MPKPRRKAPKRPKVLVDRDLGLGLKRAFQNNHPEIAVRLAEELPSVNHLSTDAHILEQALKGKWYVISGDDDVYNPEEIPCNKKQYANRTLMKNRGTMTEMAAEAISVWNKIGLPTVRKYPVLLIEGAQATLFECGEKGKYLPVKTFDL